MDGEIPMEVDEIAMEENEPPPKHSDSKAERKPSLKAKIFKNSVKLMGKNKTKDIAGQDHDSLPHNVPCRSLNLRANVHLSPIYVYIIVDGLEHVTFKSLFWRL